MATVASNDSRSSKEDILRATARQIFQAGCSAVDPRVAVQNAVKLVGDELQVREERISLKEVEEVVVLGAGKASVPMVEAVQSILNSRISRGVVITKYGHAEKHELGKEYEVFEAAHPTPDPSSASSTARLLEVAKQATEKTLVLCCISGGSSSLLCCPVDGVNLEDKQEATRQLLACGCPIHEKNAVLKHLSSVKGGQLLRACHPAKVVSLVLSDVVGDPLDSIGSGPTVPDSWTFSDCVKVLEQYGLDKTFPQSCLNYLHRGIKREVPDTVKGDDPVVVNSTTSIVAGNSVAVEAALAEASRLGYNTLLLSTFMEGEAKEVAKTWSALAKEEHKFGRPLALPACIIGGGETTVSLPKDPGVGGRNQAMALSAALQIQGLEGVAVLAGATDGGDGPGNDSAGAVVTGKDVSEASKVGLDAQQFLDRCDAYTFFERYEQAVLGRSNVMHLRDGPTGTNVADVTILIVDKSWND